MDWLINIQRITTYLDLEYTCPLYYKLIYNWELCQPVNQSCGVLM